MLKTIILFSFLFALAFGSNAQTNPRVNKFDSDYEGIRKTFEQEFQGDKTQQRGRNSEKLLKRVNHPPAEIPEWFFEDWSSYKGRNVFPGISDPGMDSLQGHEQALCRALMLMALMENYQIESVLDNYYLDKETRKTLGKFNAFSGITTTKDFVWENLQIVENTRNSNGETILLIDLKAGTPDLKPCDRLIVNYEKFDTETSPTHNPVLFGILKGKMTITECNGTDKHHQWQISQSPVATGIEWGTDTLSPVMPGHFFRYFSPEGAVINQPTKKFPQYFTLQHGLWFAMQSSILHHLEDLETFNSQVKNLDEQAGDQFQGLIRVIFSGEGSFRISRAIVEENQLSLEFD